MQPTCLKLHWSFYKHHADTGHDLHVGCVEANVNAKGRVTGWEWSVWEIESPDDHNLVDGTGLYDRPLDTRKEAMAAVEQCLNWIYT